MRVLKCFGKVEVGFCGLELLWIDTLTTKTRDIVLWACSGNNIVHLPSVGDWPMSLASWIYFHGSSETLILVKEFIVVA